MRNISLEYTIRNISFKYTIRNIPFKYTIRKPLFHIVTSSNTTAMTIEEVQAHVSTPGQFSSRHRLSSSFADIQQENVISKQS